MRSLLFLFLMVFSSLLYAEESEAENNSAPETVSEQEISGSIEFGGFQTSGNTQAESADGALELHYSFKQWFADFIFKGTQTSENGVLTSDYYESSLKGKVKLPYHTYGFVLIGYRQDVFGGIYSEITQLAGLGYHFFENEPNYGVDVELGYGARDTEKVSHKKIDHDPGTHGAIFAKYITSEKDMLEANFTIESGNDDSYIKKEFIWEHALVESFNLKLSYEERTLTAPEFGKEATDSNMSVKLGYKF